MHILGIANGTIDGNSEILLKAALKAAQEVNPAITCSWVHMPSVSIPINPKPLSGLDVSVGSNKGFQAGNDVKKEAIDDREVLLDAVMDADAFIVSTPVYSHSPAGFLKAVFDRIGGPFIDATFATRVLESQKAGDHRFANMNIDTRLLKPRVVAFLAVGGSTTPDQFTMALPILHTLFYPMHAKVVDQAIVPGVGDTGAVIARSNGQFVQRAMQLGRNVASQMGKAFDDAVYLGEEPEGACPYCHLVKIELFYGSNNKVGCVCCGALGHLKIGDNGIIRPVWDQNCKVSCITWTGKANHLDDIQNVSREEQAEVDDYPDFETERERWRQFTVKPVALPSLQV